MKPSGESPVFLTHAQARMVLHLGEAGDGTACATVIDKQVFASLFDLGLVHERPDGRFDLTDLGEEFYDELDQRRDAFPPAG